MITDDIYGLNKLRTLRWNGTNGIHWVALHFTKQFFTSRTSCFEETNYVTLLCNLYFDIHPRKKSFKNYGVSFVLLHLCMKDKQKFLVHQFQNGASISNLVHVHTLKMIFFCYLLERYKKSFVLVTYLISSSKSRKLLQKIHFFFIFRRILTPTLMKIVV